MFSLSNLQPMHQGLILLLFESTFRGRNNKYLCLLCQQPISGLTKKQSYYLLKHFFPSSHFHLSLPLGIHWPFVGSSAGIKYDIWLKSIKSLYRYRSKSHHYSQTLTLWPQLMCFSGANRGDLPWQLGFTGVKIPWYSLTLAHINTNRSLFPAQSKLYFS